jgi:hypothetical protein
VFLLCSCSCSVLKISNLFCSVPVLRSGTGTEQNRNRTGTEQIKVEQENTGPWLFIEKGGGTKDDE